MSPEKRTVIVRWLLGITTLVLAGINLPTRHFSLVEWILIFTLVALIALVRNYGIGVSFGEFTFMPVTVLLAYLVFDLKTGLAVMVLGLAIGGSIHSVRRWKESRSKTENWLTAIEQTLAPIAHHGLSLIAADWAYRVIGAPAPLQDLVTRQEILATISGPIIYLIVYNILLVIDLKLQNLSLINQIRHNWLTVLGIELLPLALAPLSAVAYFKVGLWAFILFELILLTIVIVMHRLTISQTSLEKQVTRLSSFSAMNRALRTTLDKEALLEAVYLQTANILQIRNLHVVLKAPENTQTAWTLSLAIENRRILQRDMPYRTDGFVAWVLHERLPLLAESVEQTARRLKINNPPYARSWMGVPLVTSGRVVGCMYSWLDADDVPVERRFSQPDIDLFNTVATQTSVALDNAYLYEATQQHATQLTRLNQISAIMNASLNPEKVLEQITESVIEVAGCDRAAIYLLQSESSEDSTLILAYAQGFSPEHIVRSREIAVPMSEAERKTVMQDGKLIKISDIHIDEAQISPAVLLMAQREEFSAYVYLPLRAQKQPIGMLAVYYDLPHEFSEGEVELLETFANQAALAVTNARIFQNVDVQLAQRMEQIVHMADINQRLSATLDMSTIFNLIIDSAMEGCHADAGVLVLSSEVTELGQVGSSDLNMVAWRGFDPARSVRMPHHVAESVARKVLKSGETLITSLDDPSAPGPRSQLCVPIILDEKVIGALALETERLNAFTEADMTFASQLGVQAAVAIRNAQLYNHAQAVRDRLHAILDSSNDGLVMLDTRARIVMTNARMGDFWDFARKDFTPRTPEQFQADPLSVLGEGLGYSKGQLSDLLGRCIRNINMNPETDLYEATAAGGQRRRFIERTATPVRDEQGTFIGLLLLFRDMTQQKELELAREDLTRLIVHDLRSPLQAIMGSMRLINHLAPSDNAEIVEATQISERSVQKLLNLVNDLLDVSSMESGEFLLHTSIENIGVVLQDATKAITTLTDASYTTIDVKVPPDLPYADIDRDMIERVVLNLVDNALKYSESGGTVTVRVSCKGMLRVEVIDNGPGIPDDYKEHIFERFTRIPGQKAQRRSTGLGLTFCKLAIESHGGRIWIEDNPEGGSIFSFTLPIADIPSDTELSIDKPKQPTRKERVPPPGPKQSNGDDGRPDKNKRKSPSSHPK
ncbi:MAG: GAF domain-containing protein [Anaerolineae bacterium]|nr:GAF domain-containing protein [Anaerolineae bacterium]